MASNSEHIAEKNRVARATVTRTVIYTLPPFPPGRYIRVDGRRYKREASSVAMPRKLKKPITSVIVVKMIDDDCAGS